MKIAYIGNFVPEHSTENHVKQAWENLGHTVHMVQEGDEESRLNLIKSIKKYKLVLWTRTADLSAKWGVRKQYEIIAAAKQNKVPTVAFHLDRWWGLDREASIWEEPFFRCEYVITADGGHQQEFQSVGINHVWLPPAISSNEANIGEVTERFKSDLAFVGSWRPGYHAEWTHRPQLIDWLRTTYGDRVKFWPEIGQPSIRGKELQDLYASVKVVIGDSCLVGNATNYWSDRIPETIGRGAFLLHPFVEGISDHFKIGEHLATWSAGDWSDLKEKIDYYLTHDDEVLAIKKAGLAHVIANHTYDIRVTQILGIVK